MAVKALMGNKVRRLRRARGLTQSQLAERLGVSPSYLNLIEHNRRSVTVPMLLRLAEVLGADLASFGPHEEARLLAELTEVFSDGFFEGHDLKAPDIRELVTATPAAGQAVLDLYRAYRQARDDARALAARLSEDAQWGGGQAGRAAPEEEVSDFIQAHDNHFPELEAQAEALASGAHLSASDIEVRLLDHLRKVLKVTVEVVGSEATGSVVRRYDPERRRLLLSEVLPPRSRHFQLAHQVALIGCRPALDAYVSRGKFSTPDARSLARVALANYFAGAVLMPYDAFLAAARAMRYDIELLGHRFRTSFEQVCHRLTTLQRPEARGVPFHFLRVDIAGNISKRFTASGFRFSRYGGSCPRWNVFAAFMSPGFIRTQLSRMPDGTTFFCIARTVRKEGGGFQVSQTRFAIGLGCEIGHARELVYADGIDLENLEAAVPIGTACRLCERTDCRQRAFPPLMQSLGVDENVRGLSFYVSPH